MHLRRRLLELVDDVPAHVELRALLLDDRTRAFGDESGAVVRGDEARLLAVHGAPLPETVRIAALDTGPGWSLLCALPVPTVTSVLRDWTWERATVLTVSEDALRHLTVEPPDIAPLRDEPLDHLGDIAAEIEATRRHRTVMAAWVDGKPVSFAYAALRTERWFDISVDTLPVHRNRGLARRCAAAVIADERRSGREPVWGALDSNAPSLRVAGTLGFRAVDSIWVATPEGEPQMNADQRR